MGYPADPVPDNAFFAPHHFLLPLYLVLLLYLLRLHDGPGSRQITVLVSTVVALVGWFHFWPFYPATGAFIALAGLCGIVVGAIVAVDIEDHWRLSLVVLAAIAFDDWISHTFGIPTPLSLLFTDYIQPLLI